PGLSDQALHVRSARKPRPHHPGQSLRKPQSPTRVGCILPI
ncbi:uncharacterized protein METZ01_LOCUS449628, partial [marine metagenome]